MESVGTSVKSSERTLAVLELVGSEESSLSASDIAETLAIPRSSLHGLLRTMTGRGWLRTDETGTRYRIGPKALMAGFAYIAQDRVVSLTAGLLDDLAGKVRECVVLGRLDGDEVVYLATRDSQMSVRVSVEVGQRVPALSSAVGRMVLSQYIVDPVEGAHWTTLDASIEAKLNSGLHEELAVARRRGFALQLHERADGVVGAAALLPPGYGTRNAVAVLGPASRLDMEALKSLGELLVSSVTRAVL